MGHCCVAPTQGGLKSCLLWRQIIKASSSIATARRVQKCVHAAHRCQRRLETDPAGSTGVRKELGELF
jgi:hypothetical protein